MKTHTATEKQNLMLIVGGNGKSGRRVATMLTERNVPIRIGSRSGKTPFD